MPGAGWLAAGGIVAAGAATATGAPPTAVTLLVAAGLALAAALIVARVSGRPAGAALAVGAIVVVTRCALGAVIGPAALVVAAPAGTFAWQAEVESVSSPSDDQRALVVATIDGTGPRYRLWAQLPRYPLVAPGDRIRFEGRVERPPADDGFGRYLLRAGAVGTVRARSLALVPGSDGAWAVLERVRRTVGGWIAEVLPEPQAGLATAIVIGLRDRVDRDVAASFTAAGLSHVVAISGWNIALVGATVAALLRRTPRRRRAVAIALAVAAYTLLAGATPSVVRAALMAGVALLAREAGRPGRARATLGLASLTMLVIEPTVVADAGFQLSVAATAGLVVWSDAIGLRLRRTTPRLVPDGVVESLAISLAAQAATLPIILLQFGRLSLVAPAANLVAGPLVAPVMLAGILAAVAGAAVAAGLPSLVAVPVTVLGAILVGALVAVATVAGGLPYASVTLPPPWPAATAALVAASIISLGHGPTRARLAAWHADRPPRRSPSPPRGQAHTRRPASAVATVALAVAIVPLGLAWLARPDARLHVYFLDVGQGDAILLVGDRGARILVDTGPDPGRLIRQLDAHLPAWDRHLALVVITHPHEDHVAGAALLLQRYRVDAVAETGMRGAGPGSAALRRQIDASAVPDRILGQGDRLTLDRATLLVRWPVQGSVPPLAPDDGRAVNDASIVLDLTIGQRRILLTGDAEDDVDPHLLEGGIARTRLDVLKVAHHGSRTASSPTLLEALRPHVAVISVGADNRYGHPAPETLARLQQVGARLYRTDRDGTVEVSTDGTDLRIQAAHRSEDPAAAGVGTPAGTGTPTAGARVPGAVVPLAAALPRIGPCPSRRGEKPPRCCSRASHPCGSSATRARWPRSPPSWQPASPRGATAWIAVWSRPPPCSTTSTSCSPLTIRSAGWGTARPGRAGWPSADTVS